MILNRMDAITLRDTNAYQELVSLDVTKPVIRITADPALILTSCDKAAGLEILKKEGIPTEKKTCGFMSQEMEKSKKCSTDTRVAG